jgi:hypothetical protein
MHDIKKTELDVRKCAPSLEDITAVPDQPQTIRSAYLYVQPCVFSGVVMKGNATDSIPPTGHKQLS